MCFPGSRASICPRDPDAGAFPGFALTRGETAFMEQVAILIPLIGLGFIMNERIRDIVISLLLALFLFPLMVFIGAVIFLVFGCPVLYSEKRVGLGGRPFTIYKFRTLNGWNAGTEGLFDRIVKNGMPRKSRGGFFQTLRKHSLDELPQLWNVLRGEMSLVGPRPVPEEELSYRYGSESMLVVSVRPGLTGLWQVSGRSDLSPEMRRRLDLDYVARRSGRLDRWIILRTFPAVLSGRGAY